MINSRLFFTPREVVLAREIKTYETNYQILNKKMELVEDVLADIQERDNNMYRLYFLSFPIVSARALKTLIAIKTLRNSATPNWLPAPMSV